MCFRKVWRNVEFLTFRSLIVYGVHLLFIMIMKLVHCLNSKSMYCMYGWQSSSTISQFDQFEYSHSTSTKSTVYSLHLQTPLCCTQLSTQNISRKEAQCLEQETSPYCVVIIKNIIVISKGGSDCECIRQGLATQLSVH